MMKFINKTLVIAFSVTFLTACTVKEEAGFPPHYFGNSVEQNIAAQVVNPDAPVTNEPPEHVGARVGVAQKRYVLDAVEKPAEQKTSDVGGSE